MWDFSVPLHVWNGLVRRDGFRYNFKLILHDFNQLEPGTVRMLPELWVVLGL